MSGRFEYQAYTDAGRVEKGSIDATSADIAVRALSARGLSVFHIDEKTGRDGNLLNRELFSKSTLRPQDKEHLLRLLSSLVSARLPIDQALAGIAAKDDDTALGQMSRRLHDRVVSGAALSNAMEAEGDALPPAWAAMVRAGEASGQLDHVLTALAAAQERSNRVASEIRSALIYPILLGGLAIVTVGFIVTVLLPALRPLIEETGGTLPAPIAVLMGASESIRNKPWLWLAIIAGLFLGGYRLVTRPSMRAFWHRLYLRLPIIGTLTREMNAARICSTFGLLLTSRVDQLQAVQIVKTAITHTSYIALLDKLHDHLQNGGSIREGIASADLIPEQVLTLISAGETSGRTPDMLNQAGEIMEGNAKRTLDRLVALLTPVLTLVLGLIIGGIVLSVMTTLMSINSAAF